MGAFQLLRARLRACQIGMVLGADMWQDDAVVVGACLDQGARIEGGT